MDGYQVLEALASDPQLRDLPVVMMSSVEEVDSVVRCIEMGAEDYLFKPVNAVLLRARVGASLEKKRLRDQQRELLRKFATAEVADQILTTGMAVGGKLFLEAHTKVVGRPILIDESTRGGLGAGIVTESHRHARFKTSSRAVEVYSVLSSRRT
jgi:DNA-binding response OmpR family regulator